jgi:hypothetical protein
MRKKRKKTRQPRPWWKRPPAVFSAGLFLFIGVFSAAHFIKRPQLDRAWVEYAETIPHATVEGNTVTIHELRDFQWEPRMPLEIANPRYISKTVDLEKLQAVWFLKENFPNFDGFAHTFLSFEFEGNDYVCLSVEARREVGETYSGWQGLWRKYELMYLAGTERDFIGRRLYVQNADIYLYPVHIKKEDAQTLFLSMIERMNALVDRPEFYNTLFSNCTNNLYRHAESTTDVRIPVSFNTILTGYSDITGHRMGILPNELPIEEARAKYKIDPSLTSLDDPLFSEKIREGKRLEVGSEP